MSPTIIKNQSGVSLLEVLITTFLVLVGVISVLDVFPSAWRLTTQSDRIGQASEIVHRELAAAELEILNRCNAVVVVGTTAVPTVYASGKAVAQTGDVNYSTTRTVTAIGGNAWNITVQVAWPGNAAGVSGFTVAVRDEDFAEGCL